MIGNKYLQELFDYPDEHTSLNQLLELLKVQDRIFIDSLKEPVCLDLCNDKEIEYLTKVSALADYFLQTQGLTVPDWIRDEKLRFDRPFYYPYRISDFEKLRLQLTNPAPFRIRNVYYDLQGIKRV